jgi:hypothetical protein
MPPLAQLPPYGAALLESEDVATGISRGGACAAQCMLREPESAALAMPFATRLLARLGARQRCPLPCSVHASCHSIPDRPVMLVPLCSGCSLVAFVATYALGVVNLAALARVVCVPQALALLDDVGALLCCLVVLLQQTGR